LKRGRPGCAWEPRSSGAANALSKTHFHAPPPGSRSGIADYAGPLHRALAGLGEPAADLYHLGNNGLHAEIYALALEKPGVVVLHDAVLHHFLLGSLTREQYIEEFAFNYGAWRRHLAEELWADRSSAGVDPRYFRYSLLKRVVERSKAVIVHNPGAARIAREHGARNVHVIPHYFEPVALPEYADTARFRDRLGVPPTAVLFGIFGYLRETKRVISCLQAFVKLHAVRNNTALLLAGDPVSGDLRRLLETEAARPAIHRMGHLSKQDLLTAASTIDCCLNLRYPAAGETSGIAIRMMGAGRPVIVTESEESGGLPESAVLRVSPGVAEAAGLFDQMAMVTEFPAVAREIGAQAQRHVLRHHSLDAVAKAYWRVLLHPTLLHPAD
jgi:glycosyltransferase involved in cell wall biosynthesis